VTHIIPFHNSLTPFCVHIIAFNKSDTVWCSHNSVPWQSNSKHNVAFTRPATSPESDNSSSHPPTLIKIHCNTILPSTHKYACCKWSLQSSSFIKILSACYIHHLLNSSSDYGICCFNSQWLALALCNNLLSQTVLTSKLRFMFLKAANHVSTWPLLLLRGETVCVELRPLTGALSV
jgi:hypothetical protein